MATRMQQRRGTAAQWISVNNGSGPILAAGEIGFESDTNKFKIGDGVNHWVDLTYFTDAASVLTAINGLVDGAPALLNTLNEIATALGDDPNFFHTVATNLSNHEADTTNIHGIPDTAQLATISYVDGRVNNVAATLPSADGLGLVWNATTEQLDLDLNILGDGLNFTNNTIAVTGNVARTTSGTQFTGDTYANNVITSNITVNDTVTAHDVVVGGNLTVNGTTTTVNATNLNVTDAMIYIASGNSANNLDIGVVGAYDNGTYQHTGIVRDATDGKWKIFDGLISEPGTAIDFANAPLGQLEIGPLIASGAKIGDVTNAELQRVHGVTSAIQTQLNDTNARIDSTNSNVTTQSGLIAGLQTQVDGKQDILTASSGISITGSSIGVDYSLVQARVSGISDTEILSLNNITGNIQSQLDGKANTADVASTYAPIDSPTFTTSVNLPSNTTIGTITSTELSYVDGVTSGIQSQLDSKATVANLSSHESATTSVHGIADTSKLVATTDTGTVATSMVADLAISTAKVADGAITSAKIADGTIATGDIADSAITSAKIANGTIVDADISTSAAIAATKVSGTAVTQADTGTVTNTMLAGSIAPSKVTGTAITAADTGTVTSTMILNGTIVDADINASAAIAQSKVANLTTDLAAKAALAGATFTGDVTVPNITVSGNLTVSGTTTTVSSTNLEITDPLIYIGTGNSANANDLGMVGHFNNGTYQHTGLIRDHADGKWKLFSGVTTEPSGGTISLTGATYDTLKVGTIEGTLSGSISNALTIGTGLSGTSYNGSGAVTIAIDSTVATLTGTQTLTNKTLTSPSITTPTVSSGTLTVAAAGITFSDGTVQTVAATPSLTPINAQTASITLGSSFVKDSFVKMNVASANTVTIPADSTYNYPVGASIDFQQAGAGQTSFVAAAGVTLEVAQVNGVDALKFRGKFSVATALKVAANTWAIFGDLTN